MILLICSFNIWKDKKMKQVKELNKKERGAAFLEYALLAAIVGVLGIVSLTMLSGNLQSAFRSIAADLGII